MLTNSNTPDKELDKLQIDTHRIIFITLLLISLFILFRTAWISDDAFITLRTIDNWSNGYGLVWNEGERVQTYTHPLWMLILSLTYIFIHEIYFNILIVNIAVSFFVFILFLRYFSDSLFSMIFGWAVLISSKAFIDYSTSGLENGLTHFLVLSFMILFLRKNYGSKEKHLLVLSFIAGLSTTNRMDTILFFIPSLIYLWFMSFRDLKSVGIILLGFSPFIIWEFFLIFYYGFPFPNTAYAKLNSGIPQGDLLRQGIVYFLNSITWNPITLIVIALALFLTWAIQDGNSKKKIFGVGIILYLTYVIYIGGDFMSGRFFSAPFLMSTFILINLTQRLSNNYKFIFSVLILGLGFLSTKTTFSYFFIESNFSADAEKIIIDTNTGIADEREYQYNNTSPIVLNRNMNVFSAEWMKEIVRFKENNIPVKVLESIGIIGYLAGPDVHIIDVYALSDPLLARLKITDLENWRIGHFRRDIPEGYILTLKTKKNHIADPDLSKYYDKLKVIVSYPLFSKERLRTIWEMNTGKYNYLLEDN